MCVCVGGSCAEPGAPACTHLVLDEHAVKQIPFELHPRLHVVKAEVCSVSINTLVLYHRVVSCPTLVIINSYQNQTCPSRHQKN